MILTNKQLREYSSKLNKITNNINCLLHDNGIFEIFNVTKSDADRLVDLLKKQDFITDVHALNDSYNFQKFNFSKGFPLPEYKYTIRGLLKESSLNETIEIHKELNPKIWTEDDDLRPEVRAKILQIVDKFKSQLAVDDIDLKIEDIYLLGSNANYNYNEDSDLDIHIIADESVDCSKLHLPIIYKAYKTLFNNKYNIKIKGINVEIYVENKDDITNVSNGVFSLNKGWIKVPAQYDIPEIDQLAIDKKVKVWEDKYFDITLNPSIKKIDSYIDDIYDLRIKGIQKSGEFNEDNLVFKEIRRLGYLDDLRDIKNELTSKELSLEALEK